MICFDVPSTPEMEAGCATSSRNWMRRGPVAVIGSEVGPYPIQQRRPPSHQGATAMRTFSP